MILVIGAHPSLEGSVIQPKFEPGRAFRLTKVLRTAGSKGFNFTRALRTLGQEARIIAPLAGYTGQYVYHLLQAEGLDCVEVWVSGETRTIFNIADPDTHQVTELIENGPVLTAADWQKLASAVQAQFDKADWLVMCGSLPPGVPPIGPAELVQAATAAGIRVVLDTYGPALNHSLVYRPFLVKINQHEAGDLLQQAIPTPAAALQAATQIQTLGPQAVIITLGARGAVGIDASGQKFAWAAPVVPSLCPVGSGDSMLAGVLAGLIQGQSLKKAARWGVAAGAANTLQIGPGLFQLAQVEALLEQVTELNRTGS